MKYYLRYTICAVVAGCLATGIAYGHGGGEASIEVGPDKGVTEVAKDKSFKLSPEATKNFGLKTIPFAVGSIAVPKESIVRTLKEAQIFRLRDGFLKSVDFKVVTKGDRTLTIQSTELQAKDEIVVSGVGFLRIISAQLGEAEEEGEDEHGHGKDKKNEHGHGKGEKDEHGHGEGEEHHD